MASQSTVSTTVRPFYKNTLSLALTIFLINVVIISTPLWNEVLHGSINKDWGLIGYAILLIMIAIAILPVIVSAFGLYLVRKSSDYLKLKHASILSLTIGVVFLVICILLALKSHSPRTTMQETALYTILFSSSLLVGTSLFVLHRHKDVR